jgi:hypothetical protein
MNAHFVYKNQTEMNPLLVLKPSLRDFVGIAGDFEHDNDHLAPQSFR